MEYFILFFLHVGTRRVKIAGMTPFPDSAWVAQQARNLAGHFMDLPVKPTMLIRDLDGKFPEQFDTILESENIEIKRVGPRAPNMNCYAERWVQSVRQECLDHFIVFGEPHLRYILREYESWYNEERAHQGVGNVRLRQIGADEPLPPVTHGTIVCRERLGGLLKHYHRQAA